MNEHLKFSWGHIIAFLAMIAIGYVTFMGTTYYTDGSFAKASIVTAAVLIIMMIIFIVPQALKATDRRFKKRIVWERIIIAASPVIFIAAMLPYTHFWTVYAQNDEIVSKFSGSIEAAKQMFADYDQYAQSRIAAYDQKLDRDGSLSAVQKQQMKRTLRILLLSENYNNLKTGALEWIDGANKGATVWNVFLFGNKKQFQESILKWHEQLTVTSSHILKNERGAAAPAHEAENINPQQNGGQKTNGPKSLDQAERTPAASPADQPTVNAAEGVAPFAHSNESVQKMVQGLESLTNTYTTFKFPGLIALLTMLLLYGMMLLPYLLQDYHDKNPYRLFGMADWAKNGGGFEPEPVSAPNPHHGIDIETSIPTGPSAPRPSSGGKGSNEHEIFDF